LLRLEEVLKGRNAMRGRVAGKRDRSPKTCSHIDATKLGGERTFFGKKIGHLFRENQSEKEETEGEIGGR